MNEVDAKTRHYRLLRRRGVSEENARRLATGYMIGIGLQTDTAFNAGRDDGFGDDDFKRKIARQRAHAAGVSTSGKTYYPGLCAPRTPYDPKAWISHDNSRAEIKRRCEELNYAAEGGVTVKQREPETDPFEGPYRVADKLVQREVNAVVEREHDGQITPEKRADLVEATAERLAGNQ